MFKKKERRIRVSFDKFELLILDINTTIKKQENKPEIYSNFNANLFESLAVVIKFSLRKQRSFEKTHRSFHCCLFHTASVHISKYSSAASS